MSNSKIIIYKVKPVPKIPTTAKFKSLTKAQILKDKKLLASIFPIDEDKRTL